ncbi:MAG: sigma-70 family RNA polymerase sigma factor [Gemmatimonadaceae bacterium]
MSPSVALDRTSDDDARLVQLMRVGDERGLATLYDRYAPSLLGLIQRIVRERADAEAVLMATFLQAWRSAASFDPSRGSLLSWLATIARSRAVDSARSGARRERREQLVTEQDAPIAEAEAPGNTDPLEGITQQERRTAIEAALTSLSAPQRTVIELAFFEGLTHVEIAERLAEPLGTIKTRIRQGMIKLRDLLAPLAQERVA